MRLQECTQSHSYALISRELKHHSLLLPLAKTMEVLAIHLPSQHLSSVQPQDAVVDRIVGDRSDVLKRTNWEGPRCAPAHGRAGRDGQVVDIGGSGYQDEGVSGCGEKRQYRHSLRAR